MKRLIPSQIKEESKVFRTLTLKDLTFIVVVLILAALLIASSFNRNVKIIVLIVMGVFTGVAVMKFDMVKGYKIFYYGFLYLIRKKKFTDVDIKTPFKIEIQDTIKTGAGSAAVIEVFGIDFGIFEERTQDDYIRTFAEAIKEVRNGKLVKLNKPMSLTKYVDYCNSLIAKIDGELDSIMDDNVLTDDERFNKRAPIIEKRNFLVNQMDHLATYDSFERIAIEAYYFVACNDTPEQALSDAEVVCNLISPLGLQPKLLKGAELNLFMKLFFTNDITKDFDERNILQETNYEYKFSSLVERPTKLVIDGEEYRVLCLGKYPYFVGNAWAYELFTIPETKVVFNFTKYTGKPVNTVMSRSMVEIKSRLGEKGLREDEKMNLEVSLASLDRLMQELNFSSEVLYNTECYIIYPKRNYKAVMKAVRGMGIKINDLLFTQYDGWLSMLPFLPMPVKKKENQERVSPIQSSSVAATFPYVSKLLLDDKGFFIGNSSRHPVFFNPFLRDSDRINSNMVTLGKSGGGKSFWQKKLVTSSICEGKRIFILDPDNEYEYNCRLLGGNWLDVAGERAGKINPLQVFPHLKDSNVGEVGDVSSHRIFLEQFFKTVCPEMSEDCVLNLSDLLGKLYKKFKITDDAEISEIPNAKFPTFDDFNDFIEVQIKNKDVDVANLSVLKKLKLYIEKFASGGTYSRLWNGPTTLEINTDFTVLNFQSLFMNNNKIVSSGQMLLLMRFLNQEIIKNREYNEKNNADKKIMIIVDEAHRFINPDFPVALEFMSTMAKQIRKYNGSLNVTTQNIRDFVGVSDSMRAMATAVINACQYSMIFGLAADDLNMVKDLYSNYNGGLTQVELDFISKARRGDALLMIDQNTRIPLHVDYFDGERYYIDNDINSRQTSLLGSESRDKEDVLEDNLREEEKK